MAASEAVLSRQSAKLPATNFDIRPRPFMAYIPFRGRKACVHKGCPLRPRLHPHSPSAACGLRERHDMVKPDSHVYSPASIFILAKICGFREGLFKWMLISRLPLITYAGSQPIPLAAQ